jgi:parallel beta-helix repeat protein
VNLAATTNALVSGCRISDGSNGIYDNSGTVGTIIRSNTIAVNSIGILIVDAAQKMLVKRNHLTGGLAGISMNTPGPTFVRLTGNTIRGAQTGIVVGALNVQIDRNTVSGSSVNGIAILDPADAILIFNNTLTGNTNDGISEFSTKAGVEVGNNIANNNGNFGIEGVAATDDAGGNRARGNGASTGAFFQCVFVICH